MAIRIPNYEGHVSMSPEAPGVPGSLERAGALGEQIAKSGKDVFTVTAAIQREMEHTRDYETLSQMMEQARLGLGEIQRELERDPASADKWEEEFKARAQKKRDEVRTLGEDRPDAQRIFDRHWGVLYPEKLQQVAAAGRN